MIKVNQKTTKGNIVKLIDIEIASLNASLDLQKALSKQILLFLKNFIGNVEIDIVFTDEINDFISNCSSNLKQINSNINVINNLLEILDNIKFNLSSLQFKEILTKINQYNKKSEAATLAMLKPTSQIQEFIQSMSSLDISEYISLDEIDNAIQTESSKNIDEEVDIIKNPTHTSRRKKESTPLIENTLVISEKDGLVTLPYKISELKKILKKEKDKYSSLSDVVLALYTKSLSEYKHTAISRFRESYKLIIEKENGTKKDALKLATELFSNYNLHPAVITACKNLNELDVYLSCLEYNELEDFHFFKIVYESLPVIVKTKNK